MVSHLEQISQKWAYETSIWFSSRCLDEKIVYTTSQANKLKSLFLQNNTGDGIPLQAHRGGTSLNGIGNELMRNFKLIFFCYSWFRLQSMAIRCNRRGVNRYTSHVIFLMQFAHLITCISHCMAQDEPPNVSVCALSSCLSFSCFSPSFTLSLPYSTCTLPGTPSPMSITPRDKTAAPSHNEEYCSMAIYHPFTGYEPNVLDDFHYWESSAMIFQDDSGDIDTEPSYSCDAELDDETIGKALSSTLFFQEREEPSNLRQSYHSHEESLLPAQSFFAHTRTERPVHELSSCQKTNVESRNEKRKNKDSLWKTKRALLHEQLSEHSRDLCEAHIKSLYEMEELKRVQDLTSTSPVKL